jgi:hypothetical protein
VKLFIYCPNEHYGKEESLEWQEACNTSKEHKLAIVSNIEDFSHLTSPQVIAIPEKKLQDIDETVKLGFIHKIDITDEFCEMNKNPFAVFVDPDGLTYEELPILVEKHKIRFRTRHAKKGEYRVRIMINALSYTDSVFEVI